jgi:hypothetical protein
MIALDRWFDEARRVTGGSFETILPEADRHRCRNEQWSIRL